MVEVKSGKSKYIHNKIIDVSNSIFFILTLPPAFQSVGWVQCMGWFLGRSWSGTSNSSLGGSSSTLHPDRNHRQDLVGTHYDLGPPRHPDNEPELLLLECPGKPLSWSTICLQMCTYHHHTPYAINASYVNISHSFVGHISTALLTTSIEAALLRCTKI